MPTSYQLLVEPFIRSLPRDSRPEKLPPTLPVIYKSLELRDARLDDLGSGFCYIYELHGDLEEGHKKGVIDARLWSERIDPSLPTGENVRFVSVLLYDKDPVP